MALGFSPQASVWKRSASICRGEGAIWFFVSTIIYPVSQVPETFRFTLAVNPMFPGDCVSGHLVL